MKKIILASAVLLTALAACSGPKAQVVETDKGKVSGVADKENGLTVFKGIPYAAAPVGDLRWKRPQPHEPWEGVLECTEFGNASVQADREPGSFYWKEFYQDGDPARSEDCLYLNVWTPAAGDAEANLPVVVWIHGGAFTGGYGHEIEFDGTAYSKKGVILVTINYRLGMCGFLAHPLLTEENGGKSSGNYGFYDQLAALQWVHNNIRNFGGDPGNVTVMGQSAGAGSVQTLISSPLTKDLINKAIIQSGGGLGGILSHSRTYKDVEQQCEEMFTEAGYTTLEQMRAIPAEQLADISAEYIKRHNLGWMGGGAAPCIDYDLLCASTDEVALAGDELNIPYMIGYTTEDIWPDAMKQAAVAWAGLQEEQGRYPTYVYCFSHDLPGEDIPAEQGGMQGAFHSSELWYMFGTLGNCWRPMEDADYELSERMVTYWTNFAKNGNPNGDDVPKWRPCTKAHALIQILDVK